MAELPSGIHALIQRMVERRKLVMIEGVRQERERIAARMAHENTLLSGGFVTNVGNAFGDGFTQFAKGATEDGLTVIRQSFGRLTPELAAGLGQQLETSFDLSAASLRGEVDNRGPMKDEILITVNTVLDKRLHEAKRDLAIELDLATLQGVRWSSPADAAFMDSLVGLQDRRGFEAKFPKSTQDANERLCLVMFDIDRFKDVNDKNGHLVGDEALKSIAEVAARCVKGKGTAFRWAGDEFVLLLPNHTGDEGLAVAERFRREINSAPRTSRQLTLSVSVGVAEWPTHAVDLEGLQKAADDALYDAKRRKGNVVRYFGEPEPAKPSPNREPARKQPDPGGLTSEEEESIRKQYFRTRMATCPRDQALLQVQDTTGFGQARNSLYVVCPMCGLSAELK